MTRPWRSWLLLIFGCLPASLAAGTHPVLGADLHVRVVDRLGRGVPEAKVYAGRALNAGEAPESRRWRMDYMGTTDAKGSLHLELGRGRWEIDARGLRHHAEPRRNPLEPAPVVTIREKDEQLAVDVVVWEGGRVVFEPEVEGLDSPCHLVVRATHLDAPDAPIEIEMDGLKELTLPTGEWIFEPLVPGGHVLASFLVDGRPELKTRLEATQVGLFVQSLLVAESRIVIDMRWIDEEAQPTPLDFVDLEAGLLMSTTGARWAPPDVGSFRGYRVDQTVYRATSIVPAGTWSVSVRSANVEATPESHEITIAPGASRRIEFDLESRGEFEDLFHVSVRSPEGSRVPGARVRLCEGESDEFEDCLAPRKTSVNGGVNFWVQDEVPYVVLVDADQFVPRLLEAPPHRNLGRLRSIGVRLDRGHFIEAEARDGEGALVPDVQLLARHDLPPASLPESASGFVDWRAPRRAVTDASGRLRLGGLWGSVDVEARMTGAAAAETFVDVYEEFTEVHGYARRSRSVTPEEKDPPFLRLLVRPAGSIEATLACDDGGVLPKTASVRAFAEGTGHRDERDENDLLLGAACVLEQTLLEGAFEEDLVVGPLEEGAFQLAIRPTRHARWRWVDVDDREDSPLIPVMIGETTDIGLVTLRCAPAIEIKIENSASRTPLPSATLLRGEARARRLVVGQPPTDLRELFEVAGEDYLRLTGFEEGRSLVEARFRHPLLSPEGVALSEEVTMQRGHVVSLTLSTPRFLGAIDYAGDARALRVRHEDSGAVVLQPVEDGLAIVPSLEPGSYRVELCADGECTRSRALDDALLVEEGRFTELGR